MATLIKGKPLADKILAQVQEEILTLGTQPTLVVVWVGNNAASEVYVNKKIKKAYEIGINSEKIHLEDTVTEEELLEIIDDLNIRNDVHGILVQLPLPKHIHEAKVIEAISPFKDVDGFHPENVGLLHIGNPNLVPCTPTGIMKMIASVCDDLSGKHAVVIGRSNIVGKPMAALLLNENCTVTICHSRTKDLARHTKAADIVITAVGKPKLFTKEYFSKDQIVIDVGTNRLEDGSLCGDVDFENVEPIVGYISPVPGGVGPLTIACLMANTVQCYKNS